jgi:hypothetical protein
LPLISPLVSDAHLQLTGYNFHVDRTSFKHLVTAVVIGAVLVSQVIWWAYHQLDSVERRIALLSRAASRILSCCA